MTDIIIKEYHLIPLKWFINDSGLNYKILEPYMYKYD